MTAVRTAVVAALLSACAAPAHLSEHFGAANRTAFAAQIVRQSGPPAQAVTGLDSQEASIISDTYRHSLAPRGTRPEEQPILFVGPAPAGDRSRANMPPPSVPANEGRRSGE